MMQNNRPYFPNLDGLRFFGFLLVFISHIVLFILDGKLYLAQGDLGVRFFFVLSGFLITYLLYFEKENSAGLINLKKFYKKKALRILPVLFITLFLAFIVGRLKLENLPFLVDVTIRDLPWFLGFTSNFYIINFTNISASIAILWAVSVEEQFYIVSAPIVAFIKKQNVYILLILIIILSTIFRFINADNSSRVLYSTFSVASDLAIGSLFGLLAFSRENFIPKITKFFSRNNVIILYAIIVSVVYIKMFPLKFIPVVLMSAYTAILPVIISVLFAFVILEQNYSSNSLFKAGKNKYINYLGKISYGLYAYHMIAIALTFSILKSLNVNSRILITIFSFILTILISHLSFKYIENKILKFKK